MDCSVHCRLLPVAYLIIFVKQAYTPNRPTQSQLIMDVITMDSHPLLSSVGPWYLSSFQTLPKDGTSNYYCSKCSSCSRILARVLSKLCLKSWVVETTILMGSGLRHSTWRSRGPTPVTGAGARGSIVKVVAGHGWSSASHPITIIIATRYR